MCDSARHAEDCAKRLRDANQAAGHLAGENRELRLALGAAVGDLEACRAQVASEAVATR
jgi:hypothetical protein